MNRLVVGALLALAACATTGTAVEPRQGPLTPSAWPQATDQCQAQPELPWCPK